MHGLAAVCADCEGAVVRAVLVRAVCWWSNFLYGMPARRLQLSPVCLFDNERRRGARVWRQG